MAAQNQDLQSLDKIIADVAEGIMAFKTGQVIARVVRANKIIAGANVRLTPGRDGLQIDVILPDDLTTPVGNFIATWDPDTELITLTSGTVAGVTPTMGEDDGALRLDELDGDGLPPGIDYSGVGTLYIWIKITVAEDAANDYVYAALIGGASIGNGDTIPDNDGVSGTFYRKVATFVDGVKTDQAISTSIDGTVSDDGTASSTASITTWRT